MHNVLNHLNSKSIYFSVFFLLCVIPSHSAQAEKPTLTIYAIELVYRLSGNGASQYNALLNAFNSGGMEFETVVRPLSRSQLNFERDNKSCIFPATINALLANNKTFSEANLLSSTPIDRVSVRILTQPDTPPVTKLDELTGKTIAVINGLNPNLLFQGLDVTVEYSANEETRVKMLNAKRIDAALGFVPDIMLAAEALNMPLPKYDPNLSFVSGEGVAVICHDSKDARSFISNANEIIDKLKRNGELRQILGPHADIVGLTD